MQHGGMHEREFTKLLFVEKLLFDKFLRFLENPSHVRDVPMADI